MSAPASGRRQDIEDELNNTYKVQWTFRKNVPLTEFDEAKSLRNQARFESDETTVATYAEAIKRGDNFPAVLAYRPGRTASGKLVIIDGNHRLLGRKQAGKKDIDVYEIDRKTERQTIASMTFSFNARHGRPISEPEKIHHGLFLVANHVSIEDAAHTVNLQVSILRREVTKEAADIRAKEAGVDPREWEMLSPSMRSRLKTVSTDEGLAGAVHLIIGAKLTFDEVKQLIGDLNTSKSWTKQRGIIKAYTEQYIERIQANAGGTLSSNNKAKGQTPRQRLGVLFGQVNTLPDPSVFVRAYGQAERDDVVTAAEAAIERLSALVKALRDAS